MSEVTDVDPSGQLETPAQIAEATARLVPVAESIKYRRRAQTAEGKVQEVQQQLEQLQEQLEQRSEELATAEAQRDEARHQLLATEGRISAERMLAQAGVIDVEAAYLLLGKRVDLQESREPQELADAIEQLLIDKPFLRTGGSALPPKSASPRQQPQSLTGHLAQAAQRAIRTGGRRDVAEYLRLRRQAALTREGRRS